MPSNSIKLLPVLLVCLFSLQLQAQIVTPAQTARAAFDNQNFAKNFDFKGPLKVSPRGWQNSKYFNTDRQTGLEEILEGTKEQFKNPRLQKFGGMDGGGGNALICEKNGNKTTRLLDLYEADQSDLKSEMGPGTFEDKLQFVFKRLAKIVPIHSAHYAALARDLLTKDTQWVENTTMPTIDDIKLATLPRGCTLVQVAIQRPIEQKNIPNARTYIIDKDIFNLLDEDSKAALVIHEVLYRTARYSKREDSVFTRYLTALVLSTSISEYTKTSYDELLQKNSIMCNEHDYLPALVSSNRYMDYIQYCDYKLESPIVYSHGPIHESFANKIKFDSLLGSIHQINYLATNFQLPLKNDLLTRFFELSGRNHNAFWSLISNFQGSSQYINTFFTIEGMITTSAEVNSNIKMTIKDSLVGFSDGLMAPDMKFIAGSTSIDMPNFIFKTVSGHLHLNFNNYMTYWNGNYCLDLNSPQSIECKNRGLKITYRPYSSYIETLVPIKYRKIEEKGHSFMRVKIPKDWKNIRTDPQGWIDIMSIVFDNKGEVFEVTLPPEGLSNTDPKTTILNFQTRQITTK